MAFLLLKNAFLKKFGTLHNQGLKFVRLFGRKSGAETHQFPMVICHFTSYSAST